VQLFGEVFGFRSRQRWGYFDPNHTLYRTVLALKHPPGQDTRVFRIAQHFLRRL